jgi:hypothetical protein
MLKLLKQNYATYVDTDLERSESHTYRLFTFSFISLLFAGFAPETLLGVYSMMATGLTVLTGFTFAALFTDHALASSGLPEPRNENDVQDLIRLNALYKNFGARSAYFIALSIIEVILLVAATVEFAVPAPMSAWLVETKLFQDVFTNWLGFAQNFVAVLSVTLIIVVIFIYLECLYTFYRMAETIFAILERKRIYLSTDHRDK